MINEAIVRLEHLCDTIPSLLKEMDDQAFSLKPGIDKWSKKETIGHLIDSAANNHQRFVRAQFEDKPVIGYDQNGWNEFSYHQFMIGEQLIDFWAAYNRHLIALLKCIPEKHLNNICIVSGKSLTLGFIINDYVVHMEHHLRQIVIY